jgi:arsenate reductase (thioredoxin)
MPESQVLFVCVENANRSQIAEAFARMHGRGVIDPFSAGSRPSGIIKPIAIAAMAERGYDLTKHHSKSLNDVPAGPYEYVITMGCGDECPWIPATHREDWPLPDPKNMSADDFVKVRDEIERRVLALLQQVKAESTGNS